MVQTVKNFILILLGVVTTSFAQQNICENAVEFEFLPSPFSCSEYFQCIGGIAYRVACPRGLYFSPEIRRCLSYDEANCVVNSTPSPTPSPPTSPSPPPQVSCDGIPNFDFIPSDFSCSEYFQCIDGTAYRLSCPRGMYFDSGCQTCDFPQNVDCREGTRPPPPTPSPPPSISCENVPNFQMIPSFMSCSLYFQCIDNVAYLLSCPRGLYFDEARQTCDSPDNVRCVLTTMDTPPSPPMTTPMPPAAPSCDGVVNYRFIPSQMACNEYFQCVDGTAFRLTCPRGLYFNERIQSCDNPANVQCGMISSGPPSSTSSSLPTDEVSCEGVEDFHRFAHPISCALFFECMDEEAFLVSCPVGRYFNELQQMCSDSEDVDCGFRTRRPTTTTQPPLIDPQCIDVEDGRNVSNPFSCTSYYQCIGGRAFPRFCEDGLWFDEPSQRCDLPENSNCVVTTTTTGTTAGTIPTPPTNDLCAGQEDGVLLLSPFYCDLFYRCENGRSILQVCDDGQWFDRIEMTCLPSEDVDCDLSTLPPAPTSTESTTSEVTPEGICVNVSNSTFVRSSQNCAEYFICINEQPRRRMCPRGLWFNFVQQRCTLAFEANCQLDPSFCVGVEEYGLNSFPGSCSDYFECIDGNPYAGSCWRSDLFFDAETQLCLPQDQVDCDYPPTSAPTAECDGILDFLLAGSWEDCSEYFVCYDNEKLETLRCPEGQVFDFQTQVCGDFECLF